MKKTLIKSNDLVTVSIEDGRGYVINLTNIRGVTFTVTCDGDIEIGQSSRMAYTLSDWDVVNKEIQDGLRVMQYYNENGSYPNYIQDIIKKQSKITASKIKPLSIYRTQRDEYRFYIGAGRLNTGMGNRSGCKYIMCSPTEKYHITKVDIVDNTLYINTTSKDTPYVDTMSSKPTNFIEEIWSMPREYVGFIYGIIWNGKALASYTPLPEK